MTQKRLSDGWGDTQPPRALAALPKDGSSLPSTAPDVGWLTATCNYSSARADALSGLHRHCAHLHSPSVYTDMYTWLKVKSNL